MPLDIQAFIFDMDGVLTDTIELHYRAWKRLTDEENIPFTRHENEALRGLGRRESLDVILKGAPIDDVTAHEWMRRKNDYYHQSLESMSPDDCLPGVTQFLEQSRAAGLKLGLASSSRNAKTVLHKLGLYDTFDIIGDANTVARTKPAPDVFLWTAGALQVRPMNAVIFEDAEAGIAAALEAGFWTVGIGSPANVQRAHILIPDLTTASPHDILQQLSVLSLQ